MSLPTAVVETDQEPELREIPGPSAYGAEGQRFRDLLWLLSVTEFRTTYANTALGFAWTIIKPIVFFGVIFLVLREIIRFGDGIELYGVILVLGLILFTYFQEATSRGTRSLVVREPILRKMQFPRIVIPLSVSLTAAFTLFLNLIAVTPLLFVFGLEPRITWLLFPLILLVLIAFTTAMAMLLSVLFVRKPDTGQAWSLISRLLFYASPVLFPIDRVPESFVEAIAVNPLSPLLIQMRVWVIDPSAPDAVEAAGVWFGLVVPLSIMAALMVTAVLLFRRDAPRAAEEL